MPISFLKKIKLLEGSSSDHTRIAPSVYSKDHVEGFYVFPCKGMRSKQLLFNDGFPVMIFMPERHNRIKVTVEGQVTVMESVWLCGGILKNIYIDPLDEVEHLLIARFKPASFYKIFNLSPLHFKTRPICNLSEVLDDRHASFVDSVYANLSVKEKVSFVESHINSICRDYDYPLLLNDALEFINLKKGTVSVQDILKRFGEKMNYKWLERNFLNHIGMSPKKYILLQRFLNAYADLTDNRSHDLMEIALRHGYYDQNHLLKDFKQYVGTSPSIHLGAFR
ncbi:helix-turn-helix domain-containing protein [Olivibacter sitiensis]|uniref:helix-turn-helix domain-containing protein n=1 Tax=Olivibacter sitiensis TaxID=376470 RepID=UPI00048974EE|nr:helix-turn-helix domain-containing protein [Olivibacter sitiensis]